MPKTLNFKPDKSFNGYDPESIGQFLAKWLPILDQLLNRADEREFLSDLRRSVLADLKSAHLEKLKRGKSSSSTEITSAEQRIQEGSEIETETGRVTTLSSVGGICGECLHSWAIHAGQRTDCNAEGCKCQGY